MVSHHDDLMKRERRRRRRGRSHNKKTSRLCIIQSSYPIFVSFPSLHMMRHSFSVRQSRSGKRETVMLESPYYLGHFACLIYRRFNERWRNANATVALCSSSTKRPHEHWNIHQLGMKWFFRSTIPVKLHPRSLALMANKKILFIDFQLI